MTINIIDVAGNLALTQPAIDAYKAAKPNLVSAMTFTQAPAPELPAKIKAQQNAGRVDIDLVLTGTDALAAGIEQGLWLESAPGVRSGPAGARSTLSACGGEDADARAAARASSSPIIPRVRCSNTCPTA